MTTILKNAIDAALVVLCDGKPEMILRLCKSHVRNLEENV